MLIIIILMFKIRQEPCVYVNGKPYSVRSTDDMTNHLMMTEVPNITITITITTAISITQCNVWNNNHFYQASDISSLEQKVVKEIKKEDKFMWAQVCHHRHNYNHNQM